MPPIQKREYKPGEQAKAIHIWHTRDKDGNECRHLSLGEKGATQAHLLHYGMMYYNKEITVTDEGLITPETHTGSVRGDTGICFDRSCILYALSFDLEGRPSADRT